MTNYFLAAMLLIGAVACVRLAYWFTDIPCPSGFDVGASLFFYLCSLGTMWLAADLIGAFSQ